MLADNDPAATTATDSGTSSSGVSSNPFAGLGGGASADANASAPATTPEPDTTANADAAASVGEASERATPPTATPGTPTPAASADAGGQDDAPNPDTPDAGESDVEDGDEPVLRIHLADDVPEKLKNYAFVSSSGATAYRTWEDAARGIEHKDKVIVETRAQVEALKAEAATNAARLALFEATMSEDEARAALVQQHMPEAFRDTTEDDHLSTESRRAYYAALHEAEQKADAELDERVNGPARRQQAHADEVAQALKAASTFFKATATDEFFGLDPISGDDGALASVVRDLSLTIGEGDEAHTVTPFEAVEAAYALVAAEYPTPVAEMTARLVLGGIRAEAEARRQAETARVRERTYRRQETAGTSVKPVAATPVARATPSAPTSGLDAFRRANQQR